MEIRIAPRTWRTQSAITSTSPSAKTRTGQPDRAPSEPSWTGTVVCCASGRRVTNPASTKPISAMKRPMPTEIAILSCCGTAWKTAVRNPVSTSTRITMPSSTTRPIASAQVDWVAIDDRDEGVEPEPGRQREREVGDGAHQDRQEAGDQGGAGGDDRQVRTGLPSEEVPLGVGDEPQDQRVEDHDVGHRQERDDAAADLAAHRRATLGDLEETVESADSGPGADRGTGLGVLAHGPQSGRVEAWSSATTSR